MIPGILRPIIETVIRHGANALGAIMVSSGLFTASQAETVAGAVIILASVAWSLINGIKRA